jgi:DNA polymerase III subunit epsilon
MHKRFDESRFCSIDIETTGLSITNDEMIAFACVPMEKSKILVRDFYYTLVRPIKYSFDSMKYHGISKDNLADAPTFIDVADTILNVLDGVLIGYAVEFDYGFLKRYFKGLGVKFKRDVLDIAIVEKGLRHRMGDVDEDLSFEAMMSFYGLRPCYRHNACADAFLAAQIFQFQMRRLLALGLDSTDRVIKFAKRYRYTESGWAF